VIYFGRIIGVYWSVYSQRESSKRR